jgi:hypothetical protein
MNSYCAYFGPFQRRVKDIEDLASLSSIRERQLQNQIVQFTHETVQVRHVTGPHTHAVDKTETEACFTVDDQVLRAHAF